MNADRAFSIPPQIRSGMVREVSVSLWGKYKQLAPLVPRNMYQIEHKVFRGEVKRQAQCRSDTGLESDRDGGMKSSIVKTKARKIRKRNIMSEDTSFHICLPASSVQQSKNDAY